MKKERRRRFNKLTLKWFIACTTASSMNCTLTENIHSYSSLTIIKLYDHGREGSPCTLLSIDNNLHQKHGLTWKMLGSTEHTAQHRSKWSEKGQFQ